MRTGPVFLAAAFAAALLLPDLTTASPSGAHARLGLVARDNARVYEHPSTHAAVLAVLVQQTQVQITGRQGRWDAVQIWDSVRGWMPARDILFARPWESVSTYRPPQLRYKVGSHPPQRLPAPAVTTQAVAVLRSPGGSLIRTVPAGTHLSLSSWSQDRDGKVWYRDQEGWLLGDAVQFQVPVARSRSIPVSGKGMWLTLGTIAQSSPRAIVQAAQRNGISHLYLESAISPLGFHGQHAVGPLLTAAHRGNLAVIAWVFPYLYDIAADVALTRQVAAFRTPSGDRFDGIAADLETRIELWRVRAYSQLVRAYLGPRYLVVGVTYAPQDFPAFPFSEVAHDDNVIAPMDYWHQTKTAYGLDFGHMPYGYAYAYRYGADSINAVRRLAGNVPVAPIGQTFDNFGRLEMGPHAPSGQEISGFLAGSKARGAVGVSFFQWMTTTVPEWKSLHGFRY